MDGERVADQVDQRKRSSQSRGDPGEAVAQMGIDQHAHPRIVPVQNPMDVLPESLVDEDPLQEADDRGDVPQVIVESVELRMPDQEIVVQVPGHGLDSGQPAFTEEVQRSDIETVG